jgi:hypothetical protein
VPFCTGIAHIGTWGPSLEGANLRFGRHMSFWREVGSTLADKGGFRPETTCLRLGNSKALVSDQETFATPAFAIRRRQPTISLDNFDCG